jgi:DnaK suppressor protein
MERSDEFRETLLVQRRHLLEQVAQLEDDLRLLDENVEPETTEEGQERTIADMLERFDERERAELAAIERALERIDAGTYGVCLACGEPIPLARQRALPTAVTCVPCAAFRESMEPS